MTNNLCMQTLRCYSQYFLTALLSLVLALPALANSIDPGKPTVLVTGSNRGIGLGFAAHYAQSGWNVIATARSPGRADELKQLADAHNNLVIEELDVTDVDEITGISEKYRGVPVDLLINNAGILGDMAAQNLGAYDYDTFEQVMAVNVFGPMKVSEAFADNVAMSEQKKIVTITSGAAIVSTPARFAGMQFYGISKAAVNKAMRGVQAELRDRGVIVAIISPGGVQTDMLEEAFGGNSSNFNAQTVEEAVTAIAKVIGGLDSSYNGEHLDYNGNVMPW